MITFEKVYTNHYDQLRSSSQIRGFSLAGACLFSPQAPLTKNTIPLTVSIDPNMTEIHVAVGLPFAYPNS